MQALPKVLLASQPDGLRKALRRRWAHLRRASQWRRGAAIAFAVLVTLVTAGLVFRSPKPLMRTTSPRDQPLATVHHGFLPPAQFERVSRISNAQIDGALDADTLDGYISGWMVKFNRRGLERVRAMELYADAVPYLEAVLVNESNAFVLNTVVAKEPAPGADAVNAHFDNTVAIREQGIFLAHQVNVLYVSLPDRMEGGQLEVWPMEFEDSEYGKAVIHPLENMMVEFRGDAGHRVRGFRSPSGGKRVSLVLEQYRIPRSSYGNTVDFCQGQECMEEVV
ncbi:unnamed protein product [Ostreobium quekettii]|uniref:Prolyl 4-hydroxylase alpha subunit Fe(2+) 2OG dioxygenase domain-containing protein n=1 Tax=Ostreobium quekettii TaxID=121088 RepID=A0A8S1IU31_9CHLO|nr:unnamed protein product [Ostreobium quekettii]|eukprot:evm.model.scf_217.7 EVM.evm.TU.scf_217.7   scf_217:75801-78601(+)